QEKEGVEGVSVGAILSDYQRVRVENVCKRLNLQPLAYLWRRTQEDLLREMISSNIRAMIIKVAAFGLDPNKHLGKTLDEIESYLKQLSMKYGVHVCGEGGEYETFTLDCPLFKKRIVVDSSEVVIHSADAFAPVGYLRFLGLHLEAKTSTHRISAPPSFTQRPCSNSRDTISEEVEYKWAKLKLMSRTCKKGHSQRTAILDFVDCQNLLSHKKKSQSGYQWISSVIASSVVSERENLQDATRQAFSHLQDEVECEGFCLKDLILVHLYVKNMKDFGTINSVYQSYFDSSPPARRVCVEAPLPDGVLLQIDCLVHKCEISSNDTSCHQKQVMHVQSISHWAPANIGPYSQSVKVEL
uniref:Diphthine--ammonia ligase n=1 Tax=Latimeria chalumnae TaxID=7897 RepID=H3BDI6_LATCH